MTTSADAGRRRPIAGELSRADAKTRRSAEFEPGGLAREIYRVAHLVGTFTLRSGQESTEYFDKFQFTSRPELLEAVADPMAELVPHDVEVLAGLQLGGVPLAAALAL
jgi:hypothetical protein